MKKILTIFCVISLLFTACKKEEGFPKGKIKRNIYINEEAGIKFDGGDSWELTKNQADYRLKMEDIAGTIDTEISLNEAINMINNLPRKAFRGALVGQTDLYAKNGKNKVEVWIEGKSLFKDLAIKNVEDFLYYQMGILLESEFNEQMNYQISGVYEAEWDGYSYSNVKWLEFTDHYYAKDLGNYFICIIITLPSSAELDIQSIKTQFTMS